MSRLIDHRSANGSFKLGKLHLLTKEASVKLLNGPCGETVFSKDK